MLQEILWAVKPDLIVETGPNSGGSTLYYAFLLEAINPTGKIVTMDMDPVDRWHGQWQQEVDPRTWSYWKERVTALVDAAGSTAPGVLERVRSMAALAKRVVVILDSCHEYECEKGEIEAFAPLVPPGSDLIVEDTDKFPQGAGRAARSSHRQMAIVGVDKTRHLPLLTEHTGHIAIRQRRRSLRAFQITGTFSRSRSIGKCILASHPRMLHKTRFPFFEI